MASYTKSEYSKAKSINIFDYLNQNGYPLSKTSNTEYHLKNHDSLKINRYSGAWTWYSKDIAGRSPIELLKQILMTDYCYSEKDGLIEAIKRLNGKEYGINEILLTEVPTKINGTFKLPDRSNNENIILEYLCDKRKLDFDIVTDLIKENKIYQSKTHDNAVFVGYDSDNVPKYATMRLTGETGFILDEKEFFKLEVKNSNKSYPFTIRGDEDSTRLYAFESAIDAISHASLIKVNGYDYNIGHRVSSGGFTTFGIINFLGENPQINEVVLSLDNDIRARNNIDKMAERIKGKFPNVKVYEQIPAGKDFNEDLINYHEKADTLQNAYNYEIEI